MADTQHQWFKTEQREGKTFVFDSLRRRWVALTPEEEVRQKMLYLLVEHLQVPAGLVAVEYSLKVNGLDKRADAVVFGPDGAPLMVVECKAPTVELTPVVLDQALPSPGSECIYGREPQVSSPHQWHRPPLLQGRRTRLAAPRPSSRLCRNEGLKSAASILF